jgi:hypothetical protein
MQKVKKRRIISAKECKHDLKKHLEVLFESVNQGIDNYYQILSLFPVESRIRALEASILNAKITEAIQSNFSENWKFGKYRRFILRINCYNILFKKLDNKDMPMNVRTKHVEAIENQYQLNLFEESSFSNVIEPIVFLGYKKDKWGTITDPKLVYIDEGRIQWTISRSDITEGKNVVINQLATNPPQISVRPQIKKNVKKSI